MERTAMQELQRRLFDVKIKQNPITLDEMNGFIEKEKQQIVDAFDGFPLSTRNSQNGEEYYNQTYNK